jgi:alpha-L-rhamnosidase
MNRRHFLQSSGALWALPSLLHGSELDANAAKAPELELSRPVLAGGSLLTPIDLKPARWIWYPMGRCLPSTVVLLRREITLDEAPSVATGQLAADSRYLLTVNGERVQWGPAPCDPRWPEADPLDLTAYLRKGKNVIGASVLFYGVGDGTWVMGRPGFLFQLNMTWAGGRREQVVSDENWQAHVARSWTPGHYKRWYLRAFQEEFDARLYPWGWDEPGFKPGNGWRNAQIYGVGGDKPTICGGGPPTQLEVDGDAKLCSLRARSIPLLKEVELGGFALKEAALLSWNTTPEEYFECMTPDACTGEWAENAKEIAPGAWRVEVSGEKSQSLVFARDEEVVGWPGFTIDAPAGTVVEILVHEAHELHSHFLLDTHWNSWSRFICKEGENRFETFDFEGFRWIQFIVRNHTRAVTLSRITVRRRIYPWLAQPAIRCSDPVLSRLFAANVNTLNNSMQDILGGDAARERQQYSGDCGHQLHAVFLGFNETRLPGRYVNTFSQGATSEGYFMDCWPGFDRIWRIAERSMSLGNWGPILDHGLQFAFDCYYYHLYTGETEMLKEAYPRFAGMVDYLKTIRDEDGLLKVEGLGLPCVWMDHIAYQEQRHKQCAFNLYAAAAFRHALAPLARAFGDEEAAKKVDAFGRELEAAAVKCFWDPERKLFVANRPWSAQEGRIRTCDRSLATAILFDQCPGGETAAAVKMLETCPPEMGLSYPANAVWRYWALARARSIQVVLDDFRTRWRMPSIEENNTLQEDWVATHDSSSQWSHSPCSPLILLYQGVMGLHATSAGFASCVLAPQLGDLKEIACEAHTVRGTIRFAAREAGEGREITIFVPPKIAAELILDAREKVELPAGSEAAPPGCRSYALPRGVMVTVRVA